MAQTYTHDRFDKLMNQAADPSMANLASAATYLQAIFRGNNIVHAFMGGYSLIL